MKFSSREFGGSDLRKKRRKMRSDFLMGSMRGHFRLCKKKSLFAQRMRFWSPGYLFNLHFSLTEYFSDWWNLRRREKFIVFRINSSVLWGISMMIPLFDYPPAKSLLWVNQSITIITILISRATFQGNLLNPTKNKHENFITTKQKSMRSRWWGGKERILMIALRIMNCFKNTPLILKV